MKKWIGTHVPRRLLSLALSMAMVLSVLPAGALAEEGESTPPTCTCEVLCAETVNESCPVCGTEGGQCAAVQTPEPLLEEQESQQQESAQEPETETCAHGNAPETCEACASEARVASVQALIVALPVDVTAETKEAVQSALSAVDEAKSALTESEQAKLDMTRYTALTQKLAALEAQVNNCAHGNAPETCEACTSEARVASVQKLIDALPDAQDITLENAEEVIEQMGEIDEIAMLLSEAELAKLDFAKFDAAQVRLIALSEEQNPEQTADWDTATDVSYLDVSGAKQTCSEATVVTSSASDVTWNTGWYVVQGEVAIGTENSRKRVTVNGNVNLILADGCVFTVSMGISVNEGNSLTIYAQSTDETTMGSLTATGNYSHAAIGGDKEKNAGTITINGGKIKAEVVGINAAGIGGGQSGTGGTITINGGIVEATGNTDGAGIGGGQFGSGRSITINGGKVTATGGKYAAGIGGSRNGSGGIITITGGDVTATGGESAAGIGSGQNGSYGSNPLTAGTITITGGKVNAKGRNDSSGIGGGWHGSGGTITITGGEVTAAGGETGTGIGDGKDGSGGTFSTNGGSAVIFANSISDQSGKNTDTWSGIIFEGSNGTVYGNQTLNESLTIDSGKALTIPTDTTLTIGKDAILTNDGTIDIQGTLLNRGIIDDNGTIKGKVTNDPSSGMVMYLDKDGKKASVECTVITEEYLNTNSNTLSSGWYVVKDTVTIGSRIKVSGDVNLILADGCNFTVNGGIGVNEGNGLSIYAQSEGDTMGKLVSQKCDFDAGIGGTKNGACGSVLICGGDITSTGGGNSAGIGGSGNDGHGSVAGTIAICGGTVRTFGGNNAPGIGSSISIKNSSPIQISGGTVYAQGGTNAAGIGGGGSSDGGTVTITGGTVTATGSNAPGIGGGARGCYFNPSNPTPAGNGADVTITNAFVTANGIGGPNGNGTFSVTNSVVVSDYIEDSADTSGWSGIVFLGNEGKVYGNTTLSADLTIPAGKTLTVPENATLTIGENATLTNYGTITIAGSLQNNGSIVNYGTMDEGSISGKPPKIIANYLDAHGKQQSVGCDAAITAEYLSANSSTLSAGWYVVQGEVPIGSRIKVSGDVHLILADGCNFTVSGGIGVNEGNSLTIYANDTVDGTMGSLTAQNVAHGYAGIGSDYPNACGTITINGGKITATGGQYAAGIGGGGSQGAGGIITINGGNITATGDSFAAGIGGGSNGDGGKITITGGTINANLTKSGGAGIGGGSGGSGGEITISGGDITANGGQYYAGIGGGSRGDGGKITISGGKITATGDRAAGIGGGYKGAGGEITISGGNITATGDRAAGIGGGESGAGGTFSTGTDGRAVIFASSISDQSGKKDNTWHGIIFEGSDGQVYGNQTPTQSFEIPTDKNLLIPKDIELDGAAVTNSGTVYVGGTLTGTFSGTGSVYYALTLTDCTASGVDVVTYQEKTYAKAGGTVTLTPNAAPDGKQFTGWQSGEVTIDENNSFTMPDHALTVTAQFADIVATVTDGVTVTGYATLKGAFAYANGKTATITLLADVNMGNDALTISGGEVTFSGGEYAITASVDKPAISVTGGTLHFQSGSLTNTGLLGNTGCEGIKVSGGGKLNFLGGSVTGGGYSFSILFTSRTEGSTISGGTIASVAVKDDSQVNIQEGSIGHLSVFSGQASLRGGTFQIVEDKNDGFGDVFRLLDDGYAYSRNGHWESATTSKSMLIGNIQVLHAPVKITTQPDAETRLTYGENKTLSVTAVANEGKTISYRWYDECNHIWGETDSTLSLSSLNAGTHSLYCQLTCDEYVLNSDTVTVTVNKVIVTPPTVSDKEYNGQTQTADVTTSDRYTVTKNDGGTNVGSYDVVLTLTDSSNYKWDTTEEPATTITFQITKATSNSWTTEPAIDGWTYGDTASTPTYKAKFGTVQVMYSADGTTYSEAVPTTAGSYTARFTVEDTNNFNGLSEVKDFTISPKDITVTITPNGGTYGGTINPATAKLNGLVTGDTVPVTLTYTGKANDGTSYSGTTAPTKAGNYTVKASISNPNYKLTGAVTADFTIARAQAVITVDESNKDYTKNYGDAPFQLEGITENSADVDGVQYAVTRGTDVVSVSDSGKVTIRKAGSAIITLSLPESDNYLAATGVDIKIQVNKATGGVAIAGDLDKTYDGQPVSLTPGTDYTVTGDGAVTVEYAKKDDTTYSTTAPKDAGNYTVRVTQAAGTNHLKAETSQDFTITKKEVTITGTTVAESKVYDGTTTAEITSNGTLSANYDGDNLTIVRGTAAYDTEKVGENKDVTFSGFSLDGSAAGNYTLTAQPATVKASITPKPMTDSDITVTLDKASFVYDGTTKALQVTVEFDNTVLEEGTDYTLSGNTATDADSYTLTVTGKGNYTAFTTKDWKIDKASITPVVTIENTVYGNTPNPSVSGNPGNGVVTYTYYSDADCKTEVTPKNVGTYYVKAAVAQTDNYLSGTSEAVSFQITQKALTVKAKDKTIIYGDAPANDGVSYNGFVNGETESDLGGTLAYDYSYSRYGNVGDYTITPKGLTSGNYAITFEQGTLTVQQKEIGITWGNTQLTYNGSAQIPTATPTGLENNDVITLAVSGEQTDAGNDYTAKVDAIQGTKAGNYALPQSVTTTFSIAKKEVTITGTTVAATKVYDGNTTAQIISDGELQGKCDGDNLTIVSGSAAYDTEKVGENKDVTFSGFSLDGSAAGNYTLTAQPASVKASITAKPVTLAITVEDKVFDGTTDNVIFITRLTQEDAFLEGDQVEVIDGTAKFAQSAPDNNIAVTFTPFSLTGADKDNYYITNPQPTGVTGNITPTNNYLPVPEGSALAGQTEVWVDGVAYPVKTDGSTYVALPNDCSLLTTYTFEGGTSALTHNNFPTGMAVYSIDRSGDSTTVIPAAEFDDLLRYEGCSIRINGKPGIRMITSLTKKAKELLIQGELAGYTLEEYGTVAIWSGNLGDQSLTLETDKANHNHAYKKGVSDPVFANVGELTQYTNVLVWDELANDRYNEDIVMRPYIILSRDGKMVTLYGGAVSRSIYYVAQQNAKTFPEGSAGYKYVHNIIDRVANLNQSNGSTTTAGG